MQNKDDLDNHELITTDLISEEQLKLEVNATVELFRNSISTRMVSFLNYLRITSDTNYFVSALNTNLLIIILPQGSTRTSVPVSKKVSFSATRESENRADLNIQCGIANPTVTAGFFTNFYSISASARLMLYEPEQYSSVVDGFFGGCTAFEALLHSTLDCLYHTDCLKLLFKYFPNLNQVRIRIHIIS